MKRTNQGLAHTTGGGGGTPATTVTGPDVYGASTVVGIGIKYARDDHDHGLPAAPSGPTGGTPALVLSTTAAAGTAPTFVRDDDQIIAFDATVPVTQAFSDAAATGAAAVAARRDHKHGMPASPSVPSAASTVDGPDAFGDAANAGSAATYSKGDHKHGLPAKPLGLLAISSYRPGTDSLVGDVTSNTLTDVSAANLNVTFTRPANGNVLVRLTGTASTDGSPNQATECGWGLREGTTDVGIQARIWNGTVANNLIAVYTRVFLVTGISAGSHTYKWAMASDGSKHTYLSAGPTIAGALIMEVWEAP